MAPEAVRTLGSVQNALISGVMLQWMIDPERAPSGAEVAAGLHALAGLIRGEEPAGPGRPDQPVAGTAAAASRG